MTHLKTMGDDEWFKCIMPCSWCLSQAINYIVKLHTYWGCSRSFIPGGWSIKTFSLRTPWRKALLTSSWCMGQALPNAILKMSLTFWGLTTDANVSLKSTPVHYVNPFATSLALYFEIEPSGFLLMWNNHLQSTMLWPFGGGTKDHVPLYINASISSDISYLQCGFCMACLIFDGSRFSGKW